MRLNFKSSRSLIRMQIIAIVPSEHFAIVALSKSLPTPGDHCIIRPSPIPHSSQRIFAPSAPSHCRQTMPYRPRIKRVSARRSLIVRLSFDIRYPSSSLPKSLPVPTQTTAARSSTHRSSTHSPIPATYVTYGPAVSTATQHSTRRDSRGQSFRKPKGKYSSQVFVSYVHVHCIYT